MASDGSEAPQEADQTIDVLLSRWEAEGGEASATVLCAEHPHLVEHVRRRIDKLRKVEHMLTWASPGASPGDGQGAGAHPELPPELPQDRWRLIRPLGEGANGQVWLAEQRSTRRPVAVKLLHRGLLATPRARARFEREVELASRLDHPSIARVYDSGLLSGGYFYAMEFVDGPSLTEHAKSLELDVHQRVALLGRVARAVAHAHRRGVIHRDLKPSNVLVRSDGTPVVLDFGLAKEAATAASRSSLDGALLGTPAYMSPEQAAGQEADTRADVYTLGVILFELLTGQLPHDLSGTWLDVARRIEGEPPRRPRQFEPALAGDLEAVVLHCLNREPHRRYATADELADDLDRWLAGQGVQARADARLYRLRKWLARNRLPAAAAAAFLLLATVGTAATAWQAMIAQRARAEADSRRVDAEAALAQATATRDFLVEVMTSSHPHDGAGRNVTIIDAMQHAAGVLEDRQRFADQPLLEAAVNHVIGEMLTVSAATRRGALQTGMSSLRRALDLRVSHLGPNHVDTVETKMAMAGAYSAQGSNDEAIEWARWALQAARQLPDEQAQTRVRSMKLMSNVLVAAGRQEAAADQLLEAAAEARRLLPPNSGVTLSIAGNLATVLHTTGRHEEAADAYLRLMDLYELHQPEDNRRLITMMNYGILLEQTGRLDEAIDVLERTVVLRSEEFGPDSGMTATCRRTLGYTLWKAGRGEEAVEHMRASLDILWGEDLDRYYEVRHAADLATMLHTLNRHAEADQLWQELDRRHARRLAEAPRTDHDEWIAVYQEKLASRAGAATASPAE